MIDSRSGVIFVAAMALCACAPAAATRHRGDGGDTFEGDPGNPLNPPRPPDYVNDDSGAFGPSSRQNDGAAPDGGGRVAVDAGQPVIGVDGGPQRCAGPLALGDLKVVELMIASLAGSGDRGEWVEIQSTRTCTLNINGLTIASPRGAGPSDSVTVLADTLVPPNATLLVADTDDPKFNGNLPGILFSWASFDTLKNDGDTVTLTVGATKIDTLTYPAFSNLPIGRTVSFPANCAWSDRPSWARWSYSFNYYSGILQGTPNADNGDVTCY